MTALDDIAPAFVEMAHRIVWASAASVDGRGRPRSRVLHPYWQWDGTALVGVIATSPTPLKRAHFDRSPHLSVNYWAPNQDTCTAECHVEWVLDDAGRKEIWATFAGTPEPLGYDPAIIPPWAGGPTSDAFAGLRLVPWRLRVMPGSMMGGGPGEMLTWSDG